VWTEFRRGLRIALTALVLTAPGAEAESLTDALIDAYKNSNILDQYRAVLRQSDEGVALNLSRLRPVLDYLARGDYQDTSLIDGGYTSRIGLTASMLLWDFGATRLDVEASKEIVLATRELLRDFEQSILLSAVTAYLSVREQTQNVSLALNNVRVITEQLRAAQDRFEVGEVTRTDVAQAEARLARADSNLTVAQTNLEIAREDFVLAVGRAPGSLDPVPPAPRIPSNLSSAKSIARDRHPLVQQGQHNVRSTELASAALQRAIYPAFRGGLGIDRVFREGSNNDSTDGNAFVSLQGPIYSGGAISARYRQSVAISEEARSELNQTTIRVLNGVGAAWASLNGAEAAFRATVREVEAQQIAFEGVQEEARLGARTTLNVLDAEQDLLEARTSQVTARVIADRAVYELLSSLGLLTVDYLGLNVPTYDATAYYNAVKGAPATSTQGAALDRVLKSIARE